MSNTKILENLTESQTQISEVFTTFLNDWNKDANYRDMAMKEQNRHLARIASALEKLAGGTTISSHNENYEQKLEADNQSAEEVLSITYWVDTEYKCFGIIEGDGLEEYSDAVPSSFRICTEREYTKFTKRFSGQPLLLSEYIVKIRSEQSEKEYTHDELKKLCLSKSREDLANKPKLKALLKEYGAAKANDVPNDKLAELIERINKGEF